MSPFRRPLALLALAALLAAPMRARAATPLPVLLPGDPQAADASVGTNPAAAALTLPAATDAVSYAIRLAPATPGSVRFTVSVDPPEFSPATGDDGGVSIALAGYEPFGAPGTPPQFRRVINVAVPPLGEVRVSAVASGLSSRDDVVLAPVAGEDRGGIAVSRRRAKAYAEAGSPTPPAARLLQVRWIRNQRVAEIAIEPAAYEPVRRRWTVAARIDVDVQVQPLGALGPPDEPDDPFEVVYRSTLLNYAQGRAWRRTETATMLAAARRLGLAIDPSVHAATPDTSIVLAGHSWVKLAVSTAGFYAVNFSTLRNTSLFGNDQTVRFDSLRVFTLPGYPLQPVAGFCDSCAMREVAIGVAVDAGNDSMFNANTDAFYFFAQGPSGWASDFDPTLPDTSYLNHPYETKNYYYLTISSGVDRTEKPPIGGTPLRIPTRDALTPTGGETVVTTFPDRVHFEEDHASEYWPDATPTTSTLAWEKWFWASLQQGDFFSFPFDLPDADTTQSARFRLRDWGLTDNKAYFNPSPCNGPSLDHYLDVTINTLQFPEREWDGYAFDSGLERQAVQTYDTTLTTVGPDPFLRRTGNLLRVEVPDYSFNDCPGRVDRSGVAWFEIYYQHLLQPRADTLVFVSPGASGPYRYDIGPFARNTPPRLYDVTDPVSPQQVRIDPATMWDAGTRMLTFVDTASVRRRYRVFPDSLVTIARMPATAVADAPATSLLDNLRSPDNGADYVIIYYDGFQQAAQLLAEARTQRLPLVEHGAPYITKAVPVSALYDQFSGGRTDPGAIRNFMRAAFYNWSVRPKFVMFLGDASYDYKNLKGQAGSGRPGCLLPTFENDFDENGSILRQFATDDRLLNVTNPNSTLPDFFGGRIPAGDPQTAIDAVRKVVAYDATAPFGEYRNTALLLADDDLQGNACDRLVWTHLLQTNDLNLRNLPLHEDRDYVYLHTYPTGAGATKPGARSAVKAYLNGGVSIFNYIGHGSPFKVTDESVFIDTDASSLSNTNRLFVFVAASCDVGKFNDPTVQSLGEGLVMAPTGGAVAVVSATEQALSGLNVSLAKFMYDLIFTRGTVIAGPDTLLGAGQYHVPLSAALTAAKIRASGSAQTNNRKFQLMGDPATILNLPHWWADITLADLSGTPLTQVSRGQTVVFSGRILDQPGGSVLSCTGAANVLLEDSAPTNKTFGNGWDTNCPGERDTTTSYRYSAGAMYHGNVSVNNGLFTGRFIVPMDANLGTVARARAYVQARAPGAAADSDGVGAIALAVGAGTPDPNDSEGPRITLSFEGGANSVHPDATLHIDLFDQNGIMTTGHAAQNSIIVTLDGNTTKRTDVTSSFRYAADSYQQGTASFVLPGLTVGHHRITVQAADNLATGITASQHRSSSTLEFEVVEKATLHIDRAIMFPNPIRSRGTGAGGTFVIDVPGDPLNTMVRIYTISGRLVRTFKHFGGLGQVQIPWDGKDAEGAPLANGTYLFKVYANVRDADGASSPREGDVASGRFVVVNR